MYRNHGGGHEQKVAMNDIIHSSFIRVLKTRLIRLKTENIVPGTCYKTILVYNNNDRVIIFVQAKPLARDLISKPLNGDDNIIIIISSDPTAAEDVAKVPSSPVHSYTA